MCELLGYAKAELLRLNVRDLVSTEELPEPLVEFADLRSGRAFLLERRLRRKDGALVSVEVSTKMLGDGRLLAIVRDITERKRTEEALRQTRRLEAVGRLAGGIAHDFNNLLTAIMASSELLLAAPEDTTRVRARAQEIGRASQRAASLTRQLLAFSRRQVLQPHVLDLNAIVADMETMLRRVIGEDIELVTELAPDLWRVKADPTQIEQVLMNLALTPAFASGAE